MISISDASFIVLFLKYLYKNKFKVNFFFEKKKRTQESIMVFNFKKKNINVKKNLS